MEYAAIEDGVIVATFPSAPENYKGMCFPDEYDNYASWGVFPVTEYPVNMDMYHQYEPVYTIENGAPVKRFNVTPIDIDHAKMEKQMEIQTAWSNSITSGSFVSETIPDFLIDCRRNGRDSDKDNLNTVIEDIEAGVDTEPTMWVGVSEIKSVSLVQLKGIRQEMNSYGKAMYARKFAALYQLANASTVEDVMAVSF